jgi:hypothetical protein
MNLDGRDFRHISNTHEYGHVLDYDYQVERTLIAPVSLSHVLCLQDRKIYMVDAGLKQLVRMSLEGDDMEALNVDEQYVDNSEGIAVDWVAK